METLFQTSSVLLFQEDLLGQMAGMQVQDEGRLREGVGERGRGRGRGGGGERMGRGRQGSGMRRDDRQGDESSGKGGGSSTGGEGGRGEEAGRGGGTDRRGRGRDIQKRRKGDDEQMVVWTRPEHLMDKKGQSGFWEERLLRLMITVYCTIRKKMLYLYCTKSQ